MQITKWKQNPCCFLKKINALPALFSVSPDNQSTEKKIGDSTKKFRFHRGFEGLKTPEECLKLTIYTGNIHKRVGKSATFTA